MILKVKQFQEACKKILGAVDTDSELKGVVGAYDALEVRALNNKLQLNVGNGEYFASVTLDYPLDEEFRAVIDAKVFVTLISKLTTEEVELTMDEKALIVKANKGVYKFPLKCDDKGMVVLSKIEVNNPSVEMVIESTKLQSMLDFNSKEFNKGTISQPVQRLYYLDEEGCLTFTNNTACINSFPLSQPVQVVLSQKVVKLFKLFNSDDVKFTLGHEEVGGLVQTRVRFESGSVSISYLSSNDQSYIAKFPTKSIRGMANKTYDYSVSMETKEFISALDRLTLFDNVNDLNRGIGIFEFGNVGITIYDSKKINQEFVAYHSVNALPETMISINLGLAELKASLENSEEEFLMFNFGAQDKAIVLANGNVRNVIARKVLK